jgi:threonine-phosphate decarboxylase
MIRGHGGNIYALAESLGCPVDAIIDMSSNVNPLGPPPDLLEHLGRRMDCIRTLPEVDAGAAVRRFAAHLAIPANQVLAGSGTTQLIYALPRALETRLALIVGPTYADYHDGCRQNQVESAYWLTREGEAFQPDFAAMGDLLAPCDTVYICNPNNPTGVLVEGEVLRRLSRKFPKKTFVVDESYLPFVATPERWSLMAERPKNVLVLHSMSKIFRIPGLRIGFMVGDPALIERMQSFSLPWSVNSLALEAIHYLLEPNEGIDRFVMDTRRLLNEEKEAMTRRLSAIPGIRLFPSATGFFLVRLPDPHRSQEVCRRLAQKKILVRDCANFTGLSDRFIRISLQTRAMNKKCTTALEAVLAT